MNSPVLKISDNRKKIRFPVFPGLNHQFLSDRLVDVVFKTMLKPKPQNEGEKLKVSL